MNSFPVLELFVTFLLLLLYHQSTLRKMKGLCIDLMICIDRWIFLFISITSWDTYTRTTVLESNNGGISSLELTPPPLILLPLKSKWIIQFIMNHIVFSCLYGACCFIAKIILFFYQVSSYVRQK